MKNSDQGLRILFIESDEVTFQFKKCIAQAIHQLPPLEMTRVVDTDEAILKARQEKFDVVVTSYEDNGDLELLLSSIPSSITMPIVVQIENSALKPTDINDARVIFMKRDESLAGVHRSLMQIAHVGTKLYPNELRMSAH